MFKKKDEAIVQELGDGITRKLLIHGGRLMAVEVHFKKGAAVEPHSHPHEQVGYFLKGKFEMTIEGQIQIMLPGDSYYTAPDQVHGARAFEDGVVLDVFTPQREDFL